MLTEELDKLTKEELIKYVSSRNYNRKAMQELMRRLLLVIAKEKK